MNLNEIRALVSIAELGGVTRAAGRLNRSQPAVSRRIRLLEQELGAPLIETVRGGVALTEAGRAFLPHAEAALAAIRDGTEAVRGIRQEERGTVSLALVGTLASTTLVDHLRRFARGHKQVRLELRTAYSQEVSELVRRGEALLGLRYFDDPSPELTCRRVFEEPIVVACASDHRLAGRRIGELRALRSERWVAFPIQRSRTDSFAHLVERVLLAAGLEEMEIVAIDGVTAQKRLIEAGFGIGLLPQSSVEEEFRLGTLRRIEVPRLSAAVPVSLIHRKRAYLGGAARALMALISSAPLGPRRTARPARRRR